MIIFLRPECLRWIPAFLMITTSVLATDSTVKLMQDRVEQLRSDQNVTVGGASIVADALLADFYQDRQFHLAWTDRGKIGDLVGLLESAYDHGLNPNDYHSAMFQALVRVDVWETLTSQQRVDLDLLLTDSLVRFTSHIHFGKVDPAGLDADWNFERHPITAHLVQDLAAAIRADSLKAFLRERVPEPYFYRWLRRGLARYRQIQAEGVWPSIPSGPLLKLGTTDLRVELLQERLRRTRDLTGAETVNPTFFDEALQIAVISFQTRHGLKPDGIVGPKTLRALNIPLEERIDQIRVNLERMRWIYQNLPNDYLLVDIAGYSVYLVRNGRGIWKARAQVGDPYRKTPVFRAEMRYLVFNPIWTVPPVILINDVLPEAKRDPTYLTRNHMRLLDDSGQAISIESVDWAFVSAWNFPYTVRQDAGPNNPLGRVKFVFPNRHLVYLHDTPSKDLFEHSRRTFSSGCIRVERPLELAELLLEDVPPWNSQRIQQVLANGRTQAVHLTSPLPVLLFYWTAEADRSGAVHFRTDIYGRDQRVLRALGK